MRLFLLLVALITASAAPIELPKPETSGGKPLMQTLKERETTREFTNAKLPAQVLSNLLWAALGINRADGKRTAPSAHNRQSIDLYVVMREGVYLYNAKDHRLDLV